MIPTERPAASSAPEMMTASNSAPAVLAEAAGTGRPVVIVEAAGAGRPAVIAEAVGAARPVAATAPPSSASGQNFWELLAGLPLRLVDLFLLLAVIAVADACIYWEAGWTGWALSILLWSGLFWVTGTVGWLRGNVLLLLLGNLILAIGLIHNAGFWSALLPVLFLFALAVLTRSDHRHLLDALFVGFSSILAGCMRLLGHATFVIGGLHRRRGRIAGSVLRYAIPIAAAILVVLLFGLVFTWANPVIEKWVGWFFDHLWEIVKQLLPDVERLFLWGLIAWIAAGLIRPVFARSAVLAEERQGPVEATTPAGDLGGLTALFVLGAAVFLFFFYNVVDAVYLWGKVALPEGVTYSEYARRGASWLTFALFAATLLLGLASAGFLRGYRGAIVIKGLSFLWVLLGLVMALGVLRRIHLYIGYNGLTPLRITGIFGTLITSAGLIVMAVKIAAARNLAWVVRRYIAVFLVGVTVYAVLPEQAISAGWNTSRALQGNLAPLSWLFESREVNDNYRISAEALPGLVPLLDHPDPIVAEGMAAYLFDELQHLERQTADEGWRSYQLSFANARSALERVRSRLVNDQTAVNALREKVGEYR